MPRLKWIDCALLPCIGVDVSLATPVVKTGSVRIGSPVRLDVRAFFRYMSPDMMLVDGEAYTGCQEYDNGKQ